MSENCIETNCVSLTMTDIPCLRLHHHAYTTVTPGLHMHMVIYSTQRQWKEDGVSHVIDGTGDGDCSAILCQYGQVRCSLVVNGGCDIVILGVVGGVTADHCSNLISKVILYQSDGLLQTGRQ